MTYILFVYLYIIDLGFFNITYINFFRVRFESLTIRIFYSQSILSLTGRFHRQPLKMLHLHTWYFIQNSWHQWDKTKYNCHTNYAFEVNWKTIQTLTTLKMFVEISLNKMSCSHMTIFNQKLHSINKVDCKPLQHAHAHTNQ